MYLAHTRPDLAYALSVVSQYIHNPREQHMNAVMCILRYLKNAPGKGILFAKNVNHHSIEVYIDDIVVKQCLVIEERETVMNQLILDFFSCVGLLEENHE